MALAALQQGPVDRVADEATESAAPTPKSRLEERENEEGVAEQEMRDTARTTVHPVLRPTAVPIISLKISPMADPVRQCRVALSVTPATITGTD